MGQEDSVREISTGQNPWKLHVSEALLLHLSLEPLVWGVFAPSEEAGNFSLMNSSFPEQNRQFLPGSLQLWAVAS